LSANRCEELLIGEIAGTAEPDSTRRLLSADAYSLG